MASATPANARRVSESPAVLDLRDRSTPSPGTVGECRAIFSLIILDRTIFSMQLDFNLWFYRMERNMELETYGSGGFPKIYRLRDDGLGLMCNAEGVFLGNGVPLLEASVLPGGRKSFRPRLAHEIEMLMKCAFGAAVDRRDQPVSARISASSARAPSRNNERSVEAATIA
jgi:hypothetical protein